MKKKILISVLALTLFCLGNSLSTLAGNANLIKMRLDTHVVNIGAFYDGVDIPVTGEIPKGSQAVIRVMGWVKDTTFNKKGKVLGILWMNVGTVTFHHVPNVYMLYISEKDIVQGVKSLNENLERLKLGFGYIKDSLKITPATENKDKLFKEFLKLKQSEGLYSINQGAISYESKKSSDKGIRFFSTLKIPPKVPPGEYRVDLFSIKENKIIGQVTENLTVKTVGFPTMIISLAKNHGALYGILAALVAVLAGLVMGVVFKGEKGAH